MSLLNKLEEHYDNVEQFRHYFYLAKDRLIKLNFNPTHLLNVWKKLIEGLTSMDIKDACLNNVNLLLTNNVPFLNFHYDNSAFTMLIEDVEPGIFYYIASMLKHPDYFSGFYSYNGVHYTLNQDLNDNCPIMTCINLLTKKTKREEEYRLKLSFMVDKLIEFGEKIDFPVLSLENRKVVYTNPLRYAMEKSCDTAVNVLLERGATTAFKVVRILSPTVEKSYYNFVDFAETNMNRLSANKTRARVKKIVQTRKNQNQIRKNMQAIVKKIATTKSLSLNNANDVDLNAPNFINTIETVKQRIIAEKSKDPYVVVGGVGGSGTRLISKLLATLGLNIGTDLNEAYDNLSYTLLFKHLGVDDSNTRPYYNLLCKTIKAEPYVLSQEEEGMLDQLSEKGRPGHPRDWLRERADNIVRISKEGPLENEFLKKVPVISQQPLKGKWGWKEPNTHRMFPWIYDNTRETKFIMVVRNGLDMAFSENENQVRLWGPSVLPKKMQKFDKYGHIKNTPEVSMKYWALVHQKVLEFGEKIGKRFLMINFDDMCLHKEKWLKILCDFLEITDDVIPELAPQIIYQSDGIGRFKKEDISKIDPMDIQYAKSIGFNTEVTKNTNKKNVTRKLGNTNKKVTMQRELQTYSKNYPYVVVGAVGGSGTRLIASMLYALGLNVGTYLNEAFDNNVFVFLFRRVQTLELIKPENYNKFKFYMKIMYKTFHSGMKLTKEENTLLDELSVTMGQQFTERKLREHANIIKRMIKNGPDHDLYKHTVEMFEKIDRKCQLENKPLESKWGWKAPNSHVIMTTLHKLFPKMKYIMVIRNGLDMAFSSNRNQLELWGESVFQPENMVDPNWADSPRLTLKYWCMVHKKILSEAKQMNKQFYLLKYEDMCFDKENAIRKLLQFLEVPPDQKLIDSLGKLVESSSGIGRYKDKTKAELAQLDPEDVAYVEELGFPIN